MLWILLCQTMNLNELRLSKIRCDAELTNDIIKWNENCMQKVRISDPWHLTSSRGMWRQYKRPKIRRHLWHRAYQRRQQRSLLAQASQWTPNAAGDMPLNDIWRPHLASESHASSSCLVCCEIRQWSGLQVSSDFLKLFSNWIHFGMRSS